MIRPPDRIRILHVIASSERGGAERIMTAALEALDRRAFEAWVACDGDGPMLEEYRRVSSGVTMLDLRRVVNPATVLALAAVMRRLRVHVVHTQMWTADLLGGLAACAAGVPVRVATVQGGYFQVVAEQGWPRLRKRLLSRVYRAAYRPFHRVVAVSRDLADDLVERTGVRVDRSRISVVHNALDWARVQRAVGLPAPAVPGIGNRPVVTVVANFVPMKGHRWLVEAMPRVLARHAEATFVLVGEGRDRPAVEEQVRALGLASRVRFAGSRGDALALLAASDVVVLPSVAAEGLPVVILEALALGRPVVATRVGGIPEIVEDGSTGLLVAPRDSAALAVAIDRALTDRAAALHMAVRGQDLVRARFSIDGMTRRLESLYRELLAKADGRSPAQ